MLSQKGHFKGMLFHRVIKNYVIQAGDFKKSGDAEDWTLKAKPQGHFPNSLKHEAFMLGTSRTKHDSTGLFNGTQSKLLAIFLVVKAFALLAKRHALASSAAAGGLRAAAECVQIALGHCSLLEARGLALCPVLLKLFRPSVEQALEANLKKIEESTAALAAADDWVLTGPPSVARQSGRSSGSGMTFQHKLSSSAHRFNSMVQGLKSRHWEQT